MSHIGAVAAVSATVALAESPKRSVIRLPTSLVETRAESFVGRAGATGASTGFEGEACCATGVGAGTGGAGVCATGAGATGPTLRREDAQPAVRSMMAIAEALRIILFPSSHR
jgi:hypothetical protein